MKKHDVLMFSMSDEQDWYKRGIANRNYHILNQLLQNDKINKVLSVNFLPYTKKRAVRCFYENQIADRKNIIKSGLAFTLKKHSPKLFFYSTISSALSGELQVYKNLNEVLAELNFKNIILWSYFSMFTGYFDNIKSDIKVFDTVDNWIEHHNFKDYKERLKKNYNIIDQKADLIFAVAKDLIKLFPTNKNVHWIPNGVDVDKFIIQNAEFEIKNKESQVIKGPIIGYVGIIQDRIDTDLIKYVAKENPNKSIVLIGDVWPDANIENLKQEKNIHFLNRIKYKEFSKYVSQFDVAIIPHKVNEFTKSMNPLKLYEYLACGKPVVTTPVAGIEKFKNLIYTASNKEEFNSKIQSALQDNNKELEERRIESVRKHSWKSRIKQMLDLVENSL